LFVKDTFFPSKEEEGTRDGEELGCSPVNLREKEKELADRRRGNPWRKARMEDGFPLREGGYVVRERKRGISGTRKKAS